jgi:hypothetical protein
MAKPKPETPPAAPVEASVSEQAMGAVGVFFGKLKEQSFTIMLMVGIVYYQHAAWQNDKQEMMKEIHAKEALIFDLYNQERTRLLEREKALREQRDEFIAVLKEQAAWNRATQLKESR